VLHLEPGPPPARRSGRTRRQSVDAAVHPDYRGRGLFTELAHTAMDDEASRELTLVYAFPVEAAFRGQVKVGFRHEWTVAAEHRPLLPRAPRRHRSNGMTLSETASFDARFDVFAGRSAGQAVTVHRDAEYLRWRYHQVPTRAYDTVVCERDGTICGYCVLSVDPPGGRLTRGYVVDLQVLPESDPAAELLAHRALRMLRARGAQVAITWVRPAGPEQAGLASVGFSPLYQRVQRRVKRGRYLPQLIVYDRSGTVADGGDRRERDGPRWALVPGDHDSL
jgi:hypothetical protein